MNAFNETDTLSSDGIVRTFGLEQNVVESLAATRLVSNRASISLGCEDLVEAHVENASGHGLPCLILSPRASIFSERRFSSLGKIKRCAESKSEANPTLRSKPKSAAREILLNEQKSERMIILLYQDSEINLVYFF